MWNIAWGYGRGSEGSGPPKSRAHFEQSVSRIGQLLRDQDIDLALLQEVDFASRRSHGIDQSEAIARESGLPFFARALSWKARWVPYPPWPPAHHFGKVSSGGAIFSRFPIERHEVHLFQKPQSFSFWYNLFYLFRYVQVAHIQWGAIDLEVLNAHLEAYAPPSRKTQAMMIKQILSKNLNEYTLLGGDMNAPPPESSLLKGYPDEPGTDFTHEQCIHTLRSTNGLLDAVPPAQFSKHEAHYHTFPADEPNRKLDYLFHKRGLKVLHSEVLHPEPSPSDHLPLFVILSGR